MRPIVNFLDPRVPDRFWQKVQPCPMTGCWLWTGSADPKGYGRITVMQPRKTPVLAHRFAYTALVGEITKPFLDHLCRVPSCVNPAHLEPVTNAENVLRGIAGRENATKTHCPKGHPYEGDNVFTIPNKSRSLRSRCCRACKNERNAAYRERQKESR